MPTHKSEKQTKPSRQELEQLLAQKTAELRREKAERHKLEEEMQRSETLYRTIFERAAIGIIRAGIEAHQGEFFEVNDAACQFIGYSREELANMNIPEFSHPDDVPVDMDHLMRLLEGEFDFYKLEKRFITKEGKLIWGNLTVSLVRDKEGKPYFTVSTIEDISLRKEAEAALRENNEYLEQRVKERTHKLRELSNKLVHAQESDRLRVSRDLHDSVIQIISAAKFQFELFQMKISDKASEQEQQAEYIKELCSRAIQEARTICNNLRPSELDDLGLLAAIRSLCEDFYHRTGVEYDILNLKIPNQLPRKVELMVYRILQEAFNNIEKHAQATQVELKSFVRNDIFALQVMDNGVGFEPNDVSAPSKDSGWGLMNMRERLEYLEGTLNLRSKLGEGTCLTLRIPLCD